MVIRPQRQRAHQVPIAVFNAVIRGPNWRAIGLIVVLLCGVLLCYGYAVQRPAEAPKSLQATLHPAGQQSPARAAPVHRLASLPVMALLDSPPLPSRRHLHLQLRPSDSAEPARTWRTPQRPTLAQFLRPSPSFAFAALTVHPTQASWQHSARAVRPAFLEFAKRGISAGAPSNTFKPAVAYNSAIGTPSPIPQPALAHTMQVWVTGYDLTGTTATGGAAGPGVCAVDPAVIPLGTRLIIDRVGSCVAADTGSAIVGAHIDVWVPDARTAYNLTGYYTAHW